MSEARQENLFGEVAPLETDDERLVAAYQGFGVPLDHLLLTGGIEAIADEVRKLGDRRAPQELLRRLLNLRKAGRLPRLTFSGRHPALYDVLIVLQSVDDVGNAIKELANRGVTSLRLDVAPDGRVSILHNRPRE